MNLGELIIAYRKENNMSQRQFAKKCGGVSNGYVSMLENNFNPATSKGITPSLDKLICIAAGMDMSLADLLEKADDVPSDLGEVVAQNVIYEDESDREFCDMIMSARPKEGILVREPKPPEPSAEAMALAQRIDTLDKHAIDVIRAVIRVEEKRIEEAAEEAAFARSYLKGFDKEVPIVGEIVADGSAEARYAAQREVKEIIADPIPKLRENK